MRIIIIDDNASMLRLLAALFTSAGHQVIGTFSSGTGLEEIIRQTNPDLVCLDYQLPGRDGLAILKSLKTFAPQLDVLFMTASEEPELKGKAANAGASGFIHKPFSQSQIIEELRVVAQTRQLANQSLGKFGSTRQVAGSVAVKGRRGTAVIADDNGSVRLVLKALLEESGLKVVQLVTNGAEAVLATKNHQPTLLFLDINMPIMDGMGVLPQVAELSPKTKVVMVTGSTDKEQVAEAAGLGAIGYIVKPIRPIYVENFINKLFAK